MVYNLITFFINNILGVLVEGYMIVAISKFFGFEKRFKSKFSEIALILEYGISIHVIYNGLTKNTYQIFISFIIILLIIHLNYKVSLLKKIQCYVLCLLIALIGDTIAMFLLTNFSNKDLSQFIVSNYYAWGVIISKTVQLTLLKLVTSRVYRFKNIKINKEYIKQIIALIIFILVIGFVFMEFVFINATDSKSNMIIIYTLLCLLIQIILMFILNRIVRWNQKQIEHKQLLEQYQMEYKYANELNKVLYNLRILKHDLKNHISCMWGLVETNNIEDFKIYLNNLTGELEGLNDYEIDYTVKWGEGK